MHKLLKFLNLIERSMLAALLLALIGIAAYQVLARNFFDTGLTWGDGFVRTAVFWVTIIGALVASRTDDHIRMDVITRYLPNGALRWVQRLLALFTATVCLAFAYYAVEFIRFEYEDGTLAFGAVPAWVCELVMPIGFSLMGLRYIVRAFVLPPDPPDEESEEEITVNKPSGDGATHVQANLP